MNQKGQFNNGFSEAVGGVIEGIVVSAIFAVMLPMIPQYAWMFYLGLFAISIGTAFTLMTARFTYLAGWFFGVWILLPTNLLTAFDLLIYVGIPIIGLIIGGYLKYRFG
ncbi:MAG: hypothetical protein ACOX1V_02065 [Candidatus Iainarchaeum sp.]